MALNLGTLFVQLAGDNKKLNETFEDSKKKAKEFTKTVVDESKAASVGIAAIGAALTAMGISATKAYADAQKGSDKFEISMKNIAGATKEQTDAMSNLADALERKNSIDADATRIGMGALATYKMSTGAIASLTDEMQDLMAGLDGLDANEQTAAQAADLLGKAMNGQTAILQRQGIYLTDAQKNTLEFGSEMEKVGVISDAVKAKYGGFAESLANTDFGKIKSDMVQLGNAQENFGKAIMNFVAPMLPALTDISTKLASIDFSKVFGDKGFQDIMKFVAAIALIPVALNAAVISISALLSPLGLLLSGMIAATALVKGLTGLKAAQESTRAWEATGYMKKGGAQATFKEFNEAGYSTKESSTVATTLDLIMKSYATKTESAILKQYESGKITSTTSVGGVTPLSIVTKYANSIQEATDKETAWYETLKNMLAKGEEFTKGLNNVNVNLKDSGKEITKTITDITGKFKSPSGNTIPNESNIGQSLANSSFNYFFDEIYKGGSELEKMQGVIMDITPTVKTFGESLGSITESPFMDALARYQSGDTTAFENISTTTTPKEEKTKTEEKTKKEELKGWEAAQYSMTNTILNANSTIGAFAQGIAMTGEPLSGLAVGALNVALSSEEGQEALRALSEALAPIVTLLGQILAPAIKMIAEAFKWLYSNIFRPVGNMIVEIWNGIARAINGLLGWAGVHLGEMSKLPDYGDMDKATKENTKAIKEQTALMKNTPTGLKVASMAWASIIPVQTQQQIEKIAPAENKRQTVIQITGDVYGYDDFAAKVKRVQSESNYVLNGGY